MDEKPFEALNVVPFIDIMLVLLTMVLTTANFVATGRIPVALPQASHAQVEKPKDKTIEITVDGAFHLDGGIFSKDELKSRLEGLPPETSFLIRADRAIPFQAFIDVADILKQLDFSKVAVQTKSGAK